MLHNRISITLYMLHLNLSRRYYTSYEYHGQEVTERFLSISTGSCDVITDKNFFDSIMEYNIVHSAVMLRHLRVQS